jgi:predicted enzyme related to lactoylglutathione lyase
LRTVGKQARRTTIRVDDIARAVASVRGHGGTATDLEQQPYGLMSDCTDDQGASFYLGQLT